MAATLERQIYEAIRGQCISDASAERAAALAAELAVEKFTSTKFTNTTKGEIISLLKTLEYHDRLEILREFCRAGGCEK